VFPWVLLPFAMAAQNKPGIRTLAAACAFSLLPRALSIVRFRQKVIGAILHPVGITVFLSLQWSALFRKLRGTQATWKGRAFDVG
jgi:hypothetical protein